MKPATTLPWEVETSGDRYVEVMDSETLAITVCSVNEKSKREFQLQNAAYIAHAANAYPKLVEALREASARLRGAAYDARQGVSHRSGNPVEVYSERANEWEQQAIDADNLLDELGESSAATDGRHHD